MRSSPYRLMAVALLLVSGCATPMFSGAGARSNSDPEAQRPGEASVSDAAGMAGTARVADRNASGIRSAPRDAATIEKRTAELLDSASRSQRAGRLDVAQGAYEQVLRLDPQNRTAHFQLACIADDQARFAEAERHYTILMRQTPHDPDLLASLGWSYLLQGKYDACERTLRDALHYAPAHQTALYNLGWLYGTRGDYDQALAIFRSAGSEAEAQKALAELQRSARKSPSAAVAASAPRDASSSSTVVGGGAIARAGASDAGPVAPASFSYADAARRQTTSLEQQTAAMSGTPTGRDMTAPAPWKNARSAAARNGQPAGLAPSSSAGVLSANPRTVGNPTGVAPLQNGRAAPARIDGASSEIDAYASLSPTQANQARQAEPQTYDVSADRVGAEGGTQSQLAEPVNSNPPGMPLAGQGGPVITPAAAGSGMINSRQANIARNRLPAPGTPSPNGNAFDIATATSAGNRALNALPQPRLPGPKYTTAGDGTEIASLDGTAPRPNGGAWHEAQLTAARLGLGAGPGGPFIPVGDWINPPPAPAAAPSRSTTALDGEDAGRLSAAPGGSPSSQMPATFRQPATNQTAGYGPSAEPSSAPAAPGLAPWPGRAAVPSAIPTDVTPVPPPAASATAMPAL